MVHHLKVKKKKLPKRISKRSNTSNNSKRPALSKPKNKKIKMRKTRKV
jgi:hypothetical protein